MAKEKVWFVTGCSAGFGFALAKAVLDHGHRLIASSRSPSKTPELVGEITARGGHWIPLDATDPDVGDSLAKAEAIYGRLDVVVNNAGYSIMGAFEDIKPEKARTLMETNFWGPCRIMHAVLPGMRSRRSGVIVNVSSTAGLRVLPIYSYYSASKHALEAISEGVAQEVAEFNIRVLLVEPGGFRTNFLAGDAASYEPMSETYNGTIVSKWMETIQNMHGKQVGDPSKAAERIFEAVTGSGMAKGREPSLRLPLGSDCIQTVRAKMQRVKENFDQFEDMAKSTDGVP